MYIYIYIFEKLDVGLAVSTVARRLLRTVYKKQVYRFRPVAAAISAWRVMQLLRAGKL